MSETIEVTIKTNELNLSTTVMRSCLTAMNALAKLKASKELKAVTDVYLYAERMHNASISSELFKEVVE